MKFEMETEKGRLCFIDRDEKNVFVVFHRYTWKEGKREEIEESLGNASKDEIRRLARGL